MVLLWTFMWGFDLNACFQVLRECISLRVELLGYLVILCLSSWWATRPFSKVAAPLYSQQQCKRVLISPHLYQNFFLFLIVAILVVTKWYFIVILIHMPLRPNDQHLCIFLLTTCMSSLEECLLETSACSSNCIGLSFCYWLARISYRSLIQVLYQIHDLQI